MRVLCMCLVMCLGLGLAGCTPDTPSVPDFAYADGAFTVTVRGAFVRTVTDGYTGDGALTGEGLTEVRQAVAATVTVEAPTVEGVRGMRVTFMEPAVLTGVTVSREAGTGTVTVLWPTPTGDGGEALEFPAEGAKTLLRFAEVLLPAGDVEKYAPVADGGTTVTLRSRDGDFSTISGISAESSPERTACYTFRDGSRLPVHVVVTTPSERMELYIE